MSKVKDIKRAAAVLRVSSAIQGGEDKTSVADQLAKAEEWAAAEGWDLVAVFDETAEKGWQSGAVDINDRPYVQQMLGQAQDGAFDIVLFRDNTRLGRDDMEAMDMANRLRKAGVLIGFTYDKRIADPANPNDRVLFYLGQWQANVDYTQIKKNMMGGRYRNALRGLHSIGPTHTGYERITDGPDKGKLAVNEEEAEVIRAAFRFIASGMSADAAARELNDRGYYYPSKQGGKEWLGSHLRGWLKQRALIGEGFKRNFRPGPDQEPEPVTIPAPAIIDTDLWNQAHQAYKGHYQSFYDATRTKRDEWKLYALSAGGKKGASRAFHLHPDGEEVPLYSTTRTERNRKRYRRYMCQHRLRDERMRGGAPLCDGFSEGYIKGTSTQITLAAEHLESQVLISLIEAASDPEVMKEMVAEADRRAVEAQSLEATVEEAERKLADIEADRGQVEILFRVQKKSEEWLQAEMTKLDKAEADARAILHRAQEAQDAAQRIEEAHDTLVAVFQTDRDATGRVTVKLPDGTKGKVLLPDTDTPEGLRATAEAVLAGEMDDLPVHVRQALAWLMEALDARVVVQGTTQGEAPIIAIHLGAVDNRNVAHRTVSTASSATGAMTSSPISTRPPLSILTTLG